MIILSIPNHNTRRYCTSTLKKLDSGKMLFYCGVSWLLFNTFSYFAEAAIEHRCPVGFPGSLLKHKMKSRSLLCQKDSDCFNGKCCEILGENMCIYLQENDGKHTLDSKNIKSKLSGIRRWSNLKNTRLNKSEMNSEISLRRRSYRHGEKCFEKSGKRFSRCFKGFQWRHFLFVILAAGVCGFVGYMSFVLLQREKGASAFKKTAESKSKVITVTAIYRQDPEYTVGMLNTENSKGRQPTPPSDIPDSSIGGEKRSKDKY